MKTLLQGVNEVLNRVKITSTSGALTSLTDSAKQVWIDLAVQLWNETIDYVYAVQGEQRPQEGAETTYTLVTSTREYDLPSNLVVIRYPLHNESQGYYIREYPGGYEKMRIDQNTPDSWQGLPQFATINTVTNKLRMDRAPTSAENGIAFKMLYDKENVMALAADVFPFPDNVFRALVPVVSEAWAAHNRNDFKAEVWQMSIARAMSSVTRVPRRTQW